MASYHRILDVFDRRVTDNDRICDCDIHPWDIMITTKTGPGMPPRLERWSGKIRLVGYCDVFFLICYNGNSKFEKGLIIYKDEAYLEELLERGNGQKSAQIKNEATEKSTSTLQTCKDGSKEEEREKTRKIYKDSLSYSVEGRGHEIGLKAVYSENAVNQYVIEIRKPLDPIKRGLIKGAIRFQDSLDLLESAMKVGYIAGSELTGHALGHIVGGGFLEAGGRKFMDGITSSARSSNMLLSADE